MNLNRLKREIQEQTRNGRTEVYILLEDLRELQGKLAQTYEEERIYIDVKYLEKLINEYEKKEFKRNLKSNIQHKKLVSIDEHGFKFEDIERY